MVNLIRLYISKGTNTQVIDLRFSEVRETKRRLEKEGWIVYHTVHV